MRYPSKISRMSKVQKMVFMSMLVAMALVLSFFERYIPINFSVPGAKLGLANIITLTSLFFLTFWESLLVVIMRVILGSIFVGTVSAFLYSLAGGLLSFIIMYLLIHIKKDLFSNIVISIVGAVSHNLGQLLVAGFIIKNYKIIYFLPNLFIVGIATGVVVGLVVQYLLRYLRKIFS